MSEVPLYIFQGGPIRDSLPTTDTPDGKPRSKKVRQPNENQVGVGSSGFGVRGSGLLVRGGMCLFFQCLRKNENHESVMNPGEVFTQIARGHYARNIIQRSLDLTGLIGPRETRA